MNEVLILENVTKSFRGKRVLSGVRFSLGKGSVLLIGPNGSGKTTLIRISAGLLPPDEGSVACQSPSLYVPEGNPRGSSFTALTLYRFLGGCDKERLKNIAMRLNVDRLLERRFSSVSMGEAKKLFISAIMASMADKSPHCMFIDEPFANLDAYSVDSLLDMIIDYYKSNKSGVLVISSHIVNRRMVPVFDYIATIYDGRLYVEPTRELLNSLEHVCLESISPGGTSSASRGSRRGEQLLLGNRYYRLTSCKGAEFTKEDILSDTLLLHIYVALTGGELY